MPAAAAVAGSTLIAGMVQSNAADHASEASQRNALISANYADPFHANRAYWGDQLNQFMGKGGGSQPLSYEDWAKQNNIPTGNTTVWGDPSRHSIFGVGGMLDTQTPNAAQNGQYQQQYQDYVKNFHPSSPLQALQQSPGYQFRYNQGLQALNSSLASRGLLNSGNRLAALTNYGQDYASNEYGKQFDRLAALSGASNANLGAASNAYSGNAQNGIGYNVAGSNAMTQGLGQLAEMYKNGSFGGTSSGGTGSYGTQAPAPIQEGLGGPVSNYSGGYNGLAGDTGMATLG